MKYLYILLLFHTGLNSNLIPFWHSFSSQVQVLAQDQGLTLEFNPLTLRSRISFNFFVHLSMKAWIWLSAVRRCLNLWQKLLPKAGNESHGFLLVWRKWPVMCHCEQHHNSGCKSKMRFISQWQILLICNIAFPGIQMVAWKLRRQVLATTRRRQLFRSVLGQTLMLTAHLPKLWSWCAELAFLRMKYQTRIKWRAKDTVWARTISYPWFQWSVWMICVASWPTLLKNVGAGGSHDFVWRVDCHSFLFEGFRGDQPNLARFWAFVISHGLYFLLLQGGAGTWLSGASGPEAFRSTWSEHAFFSRWY